MRPPNSYIKVSLPLLPDLEGPLWEHECRHTLDGIDALIQETRTMASLSLQPFVIWKQEGSCKHCIHLVLDFLSSRTEKSINIQRLSHLFHEHTKINDIFYGSPHSIFA